MSLEEEIKKLTHAVITLTEKINSLPINKNNREISSDTKLIPISKWNDYHDWPKSGGLRHLIFHEKSNGASIWIKRIGRRVLIDEKKFFEWAKTNPK